MARTAPEELAAVTAASTDRPIIVLGCPRSGTTLVQAILHSHPRIAIPPENRFLLPAYNQRLEFGDLEDPGNRLALGEFVVRRGSKFRDLGLDRRLTIQQISEGPPTLGSGLGIVLRAYAERFDRPRWGDKRPYYHSYIDEIMRLFPDAQIVHVVRDPRDCVASLKRMPWWKLDSHHAVAAWAAATGHIDRAERKWPGVLIPVQYERLVADPENEIRAMCTAIGEDYDPAMVEPERAARLAVPERKHWHGHTRMALTTARVGRWREELDPWEAALCESVLGGRMARLGYELTGAGRPSTKHLLRFAQILTARKLGRARRRFRDRRMQRREPNPVAALLTSAQRAAAGVRT